MRESFQNSSFNGFTNVLLFQAASLLKKTEGLVTLVVCNPNKAREEVKSVMGTLDTKGSTPNRSPTPTSKESSEKTSKSYYKIVFGAVTIREIGKYSNG